MNVKDTLEFGRKWVIFAVTVLIIPMLKLVLHNQQLVIEQHVRAAYLTRKEHEAYVSEHKNWATTETERLDEAAKAVAGKARDEALAEAIRIREKAELVSQRMDRFEESLRVELRSINNKLDAVLLHNSTLQTKIEFLERAMDKAKP